MNDEQGKELRDWVGLVGFFAIAGASGLRWIDGWVPYLLGAVLIVGTLGQSGRRDWWRLGRASILDWFPEGRRLKNAASLFLVIAITWLIAWGVDWTAFRR